MPTFQLPAGLTSEAARALERTCMAGGPENVPWPSQVRLRGNQMLVSHSMEDSGSGFLQVPWHIAGHGLLLGATNTVMERQVPYNLLLELARGKVHQVRCQMHDWRTIGIPISAELEDRVGQLAQHFGQAVLADSANEMNTLAQQVLVEAYSLADQLVQTYTSQVFRIRQEMVARLDTTLGPRLGTIPAPDLAEQLRASCNSVTIPLSWNQVELEETVYRWQAYDAVVDWAVAQGWHVTAGPLVDFTSAALPAWLWVWENDISALALFMCRYVESAVRRYGNRIRRWQLTAGSNCASVLGLSEDELLGLTGRLVETGRQVDPGLELSIGIAQPWGDFMACSPRNHSPYLFADTLIRYGVHLSAIDIEVVMGIDPRGSYCRDALEVSRILDLYALLGVPLRVTLGYPAQTGPDHDSNPELSLSAGFWGDGFNPETQARWAESFVSLALSKPRVQAVQWTHFSDAEMHQFPHCGLVDSQGQARPALARLASSANAICGDGCVEAERRKPALKRHGEAVRSRLTGRLAPCRFNAGKPIPRESHPPCPPAPRGAMSRVRSNSTLSTCQRVFCWPRP